MNNNQRLLSLDILRGFDLFCLLMLQPLLVQLLSTLNIPALEPIHQQFHHVEWQGFAFWDIIMPLFMFMSGITIPFAMSKYKKGTKVDAQFFKRLFKRFFILFGLGIVVQGNILALDFEQIRLFSNTLQAIAVGYIGATICFVYCSLKQQIIVTATLFLTYIAIFATIGKMDFTPDNNIAEVIDKTVLGRFRDGVQWTDGQWHFSQNYHYTWILSSLNFIVTVMMGLFAGTILYTKHYSMMRKFYFLFLIGVLCIVAGFALDSFIPIVKKIWTSSMTLLSGGYCFLLMALFYYVIDVKKWSKALVWLRYYGLNSIVAYCVFFVINFRGIGQSLLFGLEPYLGEFYPLLITAFQCTIVYLLVYYLHKKNWFFKA